jgi:cytochrome P450
MANSTSVKMNRLKFLKRYNTDKNQLFQNLIDQYGPYFTINAIKYKLHFVFKPEFIEKIFFSHWENYIKPQPFTFFYKTIGESGLFTTNNIDVWKKDRGCLAKSFAPSLIEKYNQKMLTNTRNILNDWQKYIDNKQPINIHDEFTRITVDNLIKCLFSSANISYQEIDILIKDIMLYGTMYARDIFRLSWQWPLPKYFKIKAMQKKATEIRLAITDLCLNAEDDNILKSLNAVYMNYEYPGDLKKHLGEQALNFIAAGHETTAALLCWTMVYLSKTPTVMDKIRQEIATIAGDKPLDIEHLAKLTYTRATLYETLRLQPPLNILLRSAKENDTLGPHQVKAGDMMVFPLYNYHRLPEYWDNPEGFYPERFLEPLPDDYQYKYIPFSLGPRSCIGREFSLNEAVLTVAMILRRYKLSLQPCQAITDDFTVALRPDRNLLMSIAKV